MARVGLRSPPIDPALNYIVFDLPYGLGTRSIPETRNQTLAKKKKVVRRAWTKEDLRALKTMAKDKQGVTKIAKALKRTLGATSVMAAKHGVSLSMGG